MGIFRSPRRKYYKERYEADGGAVMGKTWFRKELLLREWGKA
jgi:hypothetical protein